MNTPSLPTSRGFLTKTLLFRGLNLLLWLAFSALAGTGLLLALRLPPGSRGGRGLSILGWNRHEWGDLHTILAWVFVVMVILHVLLHWRWLWQVAVKKRSLPLLAGLTAGIALLILPLFLPVVSHGKEDHRENPGESSHNEEGETKGHHGRE